MKQKLASVLLVLVLFLTLATPALADPVEEPSAPVEPAAPAAEVPTTEENTAPEEADCTVAVRSNGTVWVCGKTQYGVLGDGETGQFTSLADGNAPASPEIEAFLYQMLWENLSVSSEPYDLLGQTLAAPDDAVAPEEGSPTLADLIAAGELSEDGTCVILAREYGHLHTDADRDFAVDVAEILENAETAEGCITLGASSGYACFDESCPYLAAKVAAGQSESGICPGCGKDNWGPATDTDPELLSIDDDSHAECFYTVYVCKTAQCGNIHSIRKVVLPGEPHS